MFDVRRFVKCKFCSWSKPIRYRSRVSGQLNCGFEALRDHCMIYHPEEYAAIRHSLGHDTPEIEADDLESERLIEKHGADDLMYTDFDKNEDDEYK